MSATLRERAEKLLVDLEKSFSTRMTMQDTVRSLRASRLAAIESALAAVQGPKWIPVGERLPEDHTRVLCFSAHDMPRVYWAVGGKFYYTAGDSMDGRATEGITHWQPLPTPPTE